LGLAAGSIPTNPEFRAGMKARAKLLDDPSPARWEPAYRGPVHAMVLLGGDLDHPNRGTSAQVDPPLADLRALVPAGAGQVPGAARGRASLNASDAGIEHFGYVDGRSQPLLREDDIEHERETTDGIVRWNPAFPMRQVLVRDPGAAGGNAFGSYFVFRKLEQNVRAFTRAEDALGRQLARLDPHFDPELAGAMIVGRFEDGAPVVLQRGPGMHNPGANDSDFSGHPAGLKCPFHAHIRKANPRGDTTRLGGTLASQRPPLLAPP